MTRLVFSFLFLFLLTQASAQLNGNYTIGGTAPSFANFTAAAVALSTQGISGNVNFNVRPGIYTERFIINQIPGSNTNRTVTFQAENGDSSSVLLYSASATSSTNYLIWLQNVGQVTLKKLSFQTPAMGDYSIAISLFNAPNVRLEKCHLTGSLNPESLYENRRVLVAIGGTCPNFVASNCRFQNGYRGISVSGSATFFSPDMLIEKNYFSHTAGQAILLNNAHKIRIQQNLVDSCTQGFEMRECSTAVVQHNRIMSANWNGINLINCRGTAANRCLVANNMVSSFNKGIALQGCFYLDMYYNSIHVQQDGEPTYGILMANSNRFIRLQNCAIVVAYQGTPVKSENEPPEFELFSHCNLYNGLIMNNLPPNSTSFNPHYVGPNDLHVNNSVLNNLGTPIPTITTDFDGATRSTQTPDIGADEYTPIQLSVGVMQVVQPNSDSVYCLNLPLEVVLQNTGLEALTSAILTVTLNGTVLPSITWTGNLASGQFTQVSLGELLLVPLLPNTITIQSSSPNGGIDQFSADDQLVINNLYPGLSGNYTIGGINPDFPNFTTAVAALAKGGLCGATTMVVRNGTYNEQIEIKQIKGASKQNWLTFLGESGDSSLVVLRASGTALNSFTLRLTNCRFITFKSIKIKQTSSPNNYSVMTINSGADISIENCLIEGFFGNSTLTSQIALSATPDSNFTMRNCQIWSAKAGATLGFTNKLKRNLIVENNIIGGAGDDALNVQAWQNVTIRNNQFAGPRFGIYGIQLRNFDITGNRLSMGALQSSNAIYLGNCVNVGNEVSLVVNNVITMSMGVDNTAISRGMWYSNCDSLQIIHNTICLKSDDLDNLAFEMLNCKAPYVVNNIIANVGLGLAFYAVNNINPFFNHNVYTTNGALLTYNNATLAGIQAQTGGDQQSIVAPPLWTNIETDSLRIRNPIMENMGIQTAVLEDIEGFARQFPNPDPGAFESPTAPLVQLGLDRTACGATLLDGTTPGAMTYLWNTGATTSTVTATASGAYSLTVTNAIGSNSDTVFITVLTPPIVNAGSDISICNGTTFELNGMSSDACQWFDLTGNTVGSSCFLPLIATTTSTYILKVTSANNCQASDTVLVMVLPLPAVNAGSDISICSGAAFELNGIGSDACQWSDLAGNIVGSSCLLPLIATTTSTYVLKATSTNNCQASDTVLVTVLPLPAVNAGPDISICSGASFEISGSGAGACQWSDLAGNIVSSSCLFPLIATDSTVYILTAMNSNNCRASDTMYLNTKPAPEKPIITLNGAVLSVVTSDNIQWWLNNLPIPGATQAQLIPSTTGTYAVQVTNAMACSVYSDAYFYTVSGTEEQPDIKLTVFPNPIVDQHAFVRVSGGFKPVHFAILNVQGAVLEEGAMYPENSGFYDILMVHGTGFFLIKLWDAHGRVIWGKVLVF
jgi:hypothetical protein